MFPVGKEWGKLAETDNSVLLKGKSFIPSVGLAKKFTLGFVSWHRKKKKTSCNSVGKESACNAWVRNILRRKWQPASNTLKNSMDRRAWQAIVLKLCGFCYPKKKGNTENL